MTYSLYIEQLTHPDHLFSVAEAKARPNSIPAQAGVYGWWFDETLPRAPREGLRQKGAFALAYIGIAQSGPQSRRTLRQRIANHCRGPIATSTLRRSLTAILEDALDLHPERRDNGKVYLRGGEEERLTEWMSQHARVAWVAHSAPWKLESAILKSGLALPLNIQGNAHAFATALKKLRVDLGRPIVGA
jgi:hypothetical protein